MAQRKMIAPNTTLVAIPITGVADLTVGPTVAEINAGTNFSCAVVAGYTLNYTDPDTDNTPSICDAGNVNSQTFDNAELEITCFRDSNLADGASVYNIAQVLFCNGPTSYVFVRRTGKPNTATFATGDRIDWFTFETDYHKDIDGRKTPYEFSFKGNALGQGDTFKTL